MDSVNPQYFPLPVHLLPAPDDLLPTAFPVEYLARTILEREKLGSGELSRCRGEVLWQLTFSPPWPEADEPDAAQRPLDPVILDYLAGPFATSG